MTPHISQRRQRNIGICLMKFSDGRDVTVASRRKSLPGADFGSRRISLTYVEQNDRTDPNFRTSRTRPWHSNVAVVAELARLLLAHPAGLRRWSVMRAMRKAWENAQQEVSLKFEDEVERNFRHYSADDDYAKSPEREPSDALFFRPRDKAGEVWAANPDQIRAWLAANTAGTD